MYKTLHYKTCNDGVMIVMILDNLTYVRLSCIITSYFFGSTLHYA